MSSLVPRVRNFDCAVAEACEYIGPEGVYWSKGPNLYRSDAVDCPLTKHAVLPLSLRNKVLSATRLGRRAARLTFYNVLPMNDGSLFYSFGKEIGFIKDGIAKQIKGRGRNSRILRGGCARLPDGSVVFGEYMDNAGRDVVNVFRVTAGCECVETVYSFAASEIRHVHAISWDAISQKAILTAGDIDNECRIVAFDPGFNTHEILGIGDENWRAVSLQFAQDAIYFGTDAQYRTNHLYRLDRASNTLKVLQEVNGPVFYSASVPNGFVFCTTAELCPSQTSPEAILYFIDKETETVSILARFAKDKMSEKYFQLGIINMPICAAPVLQLPISGTALSQLDARFKMVQS
jgi:hypothetical protein